MKYRFSVVVGALMLLIFSTLAFPVVLTYEIHREEKRLSALSHTPFPVTVDPSRKVITQNPAVEALFDTTDTPYTAAVGAANSPIGKVLEWIALGIAQSPWYRNLASIGGVFVVIYPGMRKEQVATAFGDVLNWDASEKKIFLTATPYSSLPLIEGSFSPGVYSVSRALGPLKAQSLVNERFSNEILAHYSTTTAEIVPLSQALTIASLIEREAGGDADRRIISGIIWNRLFIGMPLQIDATVQYAKVNPKNVLSWWPQITPNDTKRSSPYNTYTRKGLPPGPIANPSVASVLAALNPVNTSCLFYFHDSNQEFHCSDTYEEHVALLKKYFGRGK